MTSSVPTRGDLWTARSARHSLDAGRWWGPGPWAYLVLTVSWLILMLRQIPCLSGSGWYFPEMCYSDITALFYARHIDQGLIPYLQTELEYPVLTGAMVELSRRLTNLLGGATAPGLPSDVVAASAHTFFGVNALLLFVLTLLLVRTHLRFSRPWDALMIAASPAIIAAGLINWDALVVLLTSLGLLAWSRKRPALAGVWLGLGVAAKLYPVLVLVPLAVLCLRTSRWRDFFVTAATTAAAWIAVNLPVYLVAPENWLQFWTFNAQRGADLGSIWYVAHLAGITITGISTKIAIGMVVGTLAIGALLLFAPTRPRLSQGVLLMVVLFLVLNKVYSPQYVLWLLPLVVLALPRWSAWTAFTIGELVYFVAIWAHLEGIIYPGSGNHLDRLYWAAVLLRIGVQLFLCGWVVRDILLPRHDLVRLGGLDDPDGGVFDGAPDAEWLRRLRGRFAVA